MNTENRQFLFTFLSGVLLPLGQAAVTGLLVALITLLFTWDSLYILESFVWPFRLGIATLIVFWFLSLKRWMKLTDLERLLNVDINQDNQIGEVPVPRVIKVRNTVVREGGFVHIEETNLPDWLTDDQLAHLAKGVLSGQGLGWRTYTGKGKPFSKEQIESLKAILEKKGYIQFKDGKKSLGYEPTSAGLEFFKQSVE